MKAREGETVMLADGASASNEDTSTGSDRLPEPEPGSMDALGPAVDGEGVAGRRRRRFTADYKLKILREAEACREPGEIGALLRRERIYSSHLALWRRQREEAAETQLSARKRGPKPRLEDPRLRKLERENARLKQGLDRLERIRRKAASILAVRAQPLEGSEDD